MMASDDTGYDPTDPKHPDYFDVMSEIADLERKRLREGGRGIGDLSGPSDEATDRLTRLADAAVDAVKAHPEYREGDTMIVVMDDPERGGMCLYGLSTVEAVKVMIGHVRALLLTTLSPILSGEVRGGPDS